MGCISSNTGTVSTFGIGTAKRPPTEAGTRSTDLDGETNAVHEECSAGRLLSVTENADSEEEEDEESTLDLQALARGALCSFPPDTPGRPSQSFRCVIALARRETASRSCPNSKDFKRKHPLHCRDVQRASSFSTGRLRARRDPRGEASECPSACSHSPAHAVTPSGDTPPSSPPEVRLGRTGAPPVMVQPSLSFGDDDFVSASAAAATTLTLPHSVSFRPAATGDATTGGWGTQETKSTEEETITSAPPDIWDTIELREVGGLGASATVYRAVDTQSSQPYAVKVVHKEQVAQWDYMTRREIEVFHALALHPNIVQLHSAIEDADTVLFLLDWCAGGDLLAMLGQVRRFRAVDAAYVVHQLALALQHLHAHNIIHRDVKPENVLISRSRTTGKHVSLEVKLTDFGLACMRDSCTTTSAGTVAYCAPEVLRQEPFDESCDVFALGVVLFVLIGGYHPFYQREDGDDSVDRMAQRILRNEWSFDDPVWRAVPVQAKELIRQLMAPVANKRISLQDFIDSPWVIGAVKQHQRLFAARPPRTGPRLCPPVIVKRRPNDSVDFSTTPPPRHASWNVSQFSGCETD